MAGARWPDNSRAEEKSADDRRGGQREHRQPGGCNGITCDSPHQREIGHHARRMRVWHGGVGDPRAIVKNVERGRNELAEFVPKVRQAEVRKMREKEQQHQTRQKRKCAEADGPHHISSEPLS